MKSKLLFGIVYILILVSCSRYSKIAVTEKELMENDAFVKHINNMNIYVHNGGSIIKLKNVSIEGNTFLGEIERQITDSIEVNNILQPSVKEAKEHRYDLNIHTNKSFDNSLACSDRDVFSPASEKIRIATENIESIEGYSLDKKATTGASIGLILLIVLFVLLLIGLFKLFTVTSAASGESAKGSGDLLSAIFSSGSSSGSSGNSGSGNSNSGNSGNSNSGSGSGCYIATMVYGSYEAAEVMILRKFRDNTLQKNYLGRQFIKYYYRYSPLFVEKFKDSKFINSAIKAVLDKVIKCL